MSNVDAMSVIRNHSTPTIDRLKGCGPYIVMLQEQTPTQERGIHLPANAKVLQDYPVLRVIVVGPECVKGVKVGDRVIVSASIRSWLDGKYVFFASEVQILAIIPAVE